MSRSEASSLVFVDLFLWLTNDNNAAFETGGTGLITIDKWQ